MWTYGIERFEDIIYIRRDHAIYTSISFTEKDKEARRQETIKWILSVTEEIMQVFPDEYTAFIEDVTIPCLKEVSTDN